MEQSLPIYTSVLGKVIEMAPVHLKSRLVIKKGVENVILKLEEIILFYTEDKMVYLLHQNGVKYIYDKNLGELEKILDPQVFFRASRKYILNINYIKSYKCFEKVKLTVQFKIPDIDHKVIISQEMAPLFKKWIADL